MSNKICLHKDVEKEVHMGIRTGDRICRGCGDVFASSQELADARADAKMKAAINRGIELLTLCQQLQSEKDGVDRPAPGVIDKSKTLDQFAMDIDSSITYMSALHKLLPMSKKLANLGRRLESQGGVRVDSGDDYTRAALDYLLAKHGVEQEK